ncbi:ATP-binding protein [Stappia sp. BW2]|uniref:ATP-binding protein n=1 Tax=Stappia sp. BW2 TaxID=2592622 RepID=UPI001AD947A4|nr:ATP-binding protein [Stappia sp. BW2]
MQADTPPGFGRNSSNDALTDFLQQRLDRLVDQSIEIAKSNGYAPFTTTIRAAWVEAIVSVTNALGTYLASSDDAPNGPIATLDYASDPRFSRMRLIARMHRSQGITLQMYLGLFKHFRNLYVSELARLPGGVTAQEASRVRDFFDHCELSISADWHDNNDNRRLRELQERSRAITLDKDRYFAVFESLRNAAFLLDHGGNLVNANQAAAGLFLGRDAQAGDIIYLRSMRRRKSSLQAVIDKIMENTEASEDPVWLDTLDGPRCFDVRTRTLHDAVENTALGHVVLLNDVTAHMRDAEEAKQSERGMSRFLATMSHEIRTPLHSVLGAVELLRTADQATSETFLDVIEGAGKALLQTLNNVLNYSKFENDPPVPRPTDTDLFEEIRVYSRIAIIGRNVARTPLEFDIGVDVPKSAYVDWGMIQQVLSNLVSNAQKADNGEGVAVAIRRIAAEAGREALRFEVRDHGPGLPEHAATALFRPFENTTARDTGNGGSGLGLAISHHLVDAMAGRIGYENLEKGALVWFEVPLFHAETLDPTGPRSQSHTTGKLPNAQSCMLVDDDPIGANVTAHQLERIGLKVTRAASVKEAKHHAAEAEFDVYVVDYLLPDGDGPTLIQYLQERTSRQAKFLALTANVDALVGRSTGFDEVLAKPAGQVSLSSAIFGLGPRSFSTGPTGHEEPESLQGLAPGTVQAMIDVFASNWSDFRRQLRAADTPRRVLTLSAHRLAGSSAILALPELESALRNLEADGNDKDKPVNLATHRSLLDRDLAEIPSWRRLNAAWAAE